MIAELDEHNVLEKQNKDQTQNSHKQWEQQFTVNQQQH